MKSERAREELVKIAKELIEKEPGLHMYKSLFRSQEKRRENEDNKKE
ncbi:MAG: hypothetical protein QXI11_04645 [Thermoproteota archaeon]